MSLLPSMTASAVENGVYDSYFLNADQMLLPPLTIFTTGEPIALTPSMKGQVFITTFNSFNFLSAGLVGTPAGFYVMVKNGGSGTPIVQENSVAIQGVTFGLGPSQASSILTNSSLCYVYWNGTNLTLY